MKNYDLCYLISPELKIEEANTLASKITGFVQNESGLIRKSENPVPKTLGYQIKKQRSALWVNLEFSLEPEKLNAIEEKIKKESKILRYLITVKNPPRREKEKRTKGKEKSPIGEKVSKEGNLVDSSIIAPVKSLETKETEKKVELKDIDEKLEEILKE